jgi:hypothetical protein
LCYDWRQPGLAGHATLETMAEGGWNIINGDCVMTSKHCKEVKNKKSQEES